MPELTPERLREIEAYARSSDTGIEPITLRSAEECAVFNRVLEQLEAQSSCIGKIRYSPESAERAASAMKRKTGKLFDAYKCRHCDGFHIGKTMERP